MEECDLEVFEEIYKTYETLRTLSIPQHFLKVTKMVCSVYENLIAVISSCGRVDIFNYEYFYGLKGLTFGPGEQPTSVCIIDGYQVMIVSCSNGNLYFFRFEQISPTSLKIDLVESFDLRSKIFGSGVENRGQKYKSKQANRETDNQVSSNSKYQNLSMRQRYKNKVDSLIKKL